MSQAADSCPRCQGEKVQGYALDFTLLGVRVGFWNADPPQKAGLADRIVTHAASAVALAAPAAICYISQQWHFHLFCQLPS
jgi:hypothetical protein